MASLSYVHLETVSHTSFRAPALIHAEFHMAHCRKKCFRWWRKLISLGMLAFSFELYDICVPPSVSQDITSYYNLLGRECSGSIWALLKGILPLVLWDSPLSLDSKVNCLVSLSKWTVSVKTGILLDLKCFQNIFHINYIVQHRYC